MPHDRRYSDIRQDTARAIRQLRRSPGFATVATLTLALGIGATTAVFAVVDAVMLRPLPFADPAHLALVRRALPGAAVSGELTYPEYRDVIISARAFSGVAAVPSSLQPAIWTDGTSTDPLVAIMSDAVKAAMRVDLDVARAIEIGRNECRDRAAPRQARAEADDRADGSEHPSLGEQLPDESRAIRT